MDEKEREVVLGFSLIPKIEDLTRVNWKNVCMIKFDDVLGD